MLCQTRRFSLSLFDLMVVWTHAAQQEAGSAEKWSDMESHENKDVNLREETKQ